MGRCGQQTAHAHKSACKINSCQLSAVSFYYLASGPYILRMYNYCSGAVCTTVGYVLDRGPSHQHLLSRVHPVHNHAGH